MILNLLTSLDWMTFTRWTPGELITLALATGVFFRHFAVVLAAEQGRKRDLLRFSHKSLISQMMLCVVIPCESTTQLSDLQVTLAHLTGQNYPANLLKVYLVSAQPVSDTLSAMLSQVDPARQVKNLVYPLSDKPARVELLRWAMERVLAQVGHGGLVVLNPGDAVKSDFCAIVAGRLLEHPVVQGNILDRAAPRTLLSCLQSVGNRMRNRVSNAGRWHLGLHPWLLETGWAIRQELLEMVPYRARLHLRNPEYTIQLAMNGHRVMWAPAVQVFKEQPGLSIKHLGDLLLSMLDQTRLVLLYGPVLLLKTLTSLDFRFVDMALYLLKPPAVLLGLALLAMAWSTYAIGYPPGGFKLYALMAVMVGIGQVIALLVGRGKLTDLFSMVVLTLPGYIWSAVFLPFTLGHIIERLSQKTAPPTARYRQVTRTRFQDELFVPLEPILEEQARGQWTPEDAGLSQSYRSDWTPRYEDAPPQRPEKEEAEPMASQASPPQTFWLSNGQKKLPCEVTVLRQDGRFQLKLAYRGQSTTTEWHTTMDSADEELTERLAEHGLTLLAPTTV